jgi:hypothetical protein
MVPEAQIIFVSILLFIPGNFFIPFCGKFLCVDILLFTNPTGS